MAHVGFSDATHEPAARLAHELCAVAPPGLSRVFFSDNGSTAVEVAMKMAYQFWQQTGNAADAQRTKFVTIGGAYHGDTVGAVSLGGIDLFHEVYRPLLFPTLQAPQPYCYRCPLGLERATCDVACAGAAERLIAEHANEIAAVVIEPGVQGAAGMVTQPEGYAARIAAAARAAGALVIVDEVAVGFGRSGKLFASEAEGLQPDFLCLAKGLTGGYLPMAATLTTERIFEGFLGRPEEGRTFFHGHTYTGNALAAAAAHATLDLLPEVLDALPEAIAHFAARAERLRGLPHVGEVRRYGLALGVELVQDAASRAAFPSARRTGMRVCTEAKRRGVFLRPIGDVVIVMPPLTITRDELDTLFDALEAGIGVACG
jgi:adenosylmethionine-8-amino-7-oxononanoate aminotransferase